MNIKKGFERFYCLRNSRIIKWIHVITMMIAISLYYCDVLFFPIDLFRERVKKWCLLSVIAIIPALTLGLDIMIKRKQERREKTQDA